MPGVKRLAAVGLAAASVLFCFIAPTAARAADDSAATAKAAAYLAAQIKTDHVESSWGDVGATADVVLALAAARDSQYDDEIAAMVGYLKTNASGYIDGSPEAAAKLALVAATVGADPTSFGGKDLIAGVKAGIAADGAFGGWPGPFAQGFGVLALARNGEAVPQEMVSWLLDSGFHNGDGGYAFSETDPSDGDSTGMAVLALAALPDPSCDVLTTILDAKEWSADAQNAAGYWAGYSPVNTTGVLGSALQSVGAGQTKALSWMVGQQLADGGLPASLGGATSDLMATTQGIFLLAGTSYLDVPEGSDALEVTTLPTSCSTSTTTATRKPTQSTGTSGTTAAGRSESTSTNGSGSSTTDAGSTQSAAAGTTGSTPSESGGTTRVLPQTGTEANPLLAVGAVLLLTAGTGLVIAGRRRKP